MTVRLRLTCKQRREAFLVGTDASRMGYRISTWIEDASTYDDASPIPVYTRVPFLEHMFLLQKATNGGGSDLTYKELLSFSYFKRIYTIEDIGVLPNSSADAIDGITWYEFYTNAYKTTATAIVDPEDELSPDENHLSSNRFYISNMLVREFLPSNTSTTSDAYNAAVQHAEDILINVSTFSHRFYVSSENFSMILTEYTY